LSEMKLEAALHCASSIISVIRLKDFRHSERMLLMTIN
jgi:hypothetical protein